MKGVWPDPECGAQCWVKGAGGGTASPSIIVLRMTMARQEQGDAGHITRVLHFMSVSHLGEVDDLLVKRCFV